jgi:hypothetical protein
MSHLPSERLAAFVDESPSPTELLHLAGCAECTRERAMYQSLADLATAESARIGTPLTSWESLAPVLRADGVIDQGRGLRFRARQVRRPWLQAAAAVLFVAGGMMAGRYTAGASVLPMNDPAVAAVTAPRADSVTHFASIEDARAAQVRSQLAYESATAWLAQRDTASIAPETPAGMRTRLAALDRTRQVMGDALRDSPYDPVMNGFYMSALGQREATLQQLNTVMPASMRATSY